MRTWLFATTGGSHGRHHRLGQLGSHGARVARDLASRLGYAFADKSVINKVIRQYGLTRLDLLYDRKPKVWELFNENSAVTIEMMNSTIAAIAARGDVVILGRGGFRVLAGMDDVVNVFVKAPESVRAKRIAKRNHIEQGEAAELIRADDELRARFVKLFYSADWADASGIEVDPVLARTVAEAMARRAGQGLRTHSVRAWSSPP